jgi:hypothetical protein
MKNRHVPIWDNPSGDYCSECRAMGIPLVVHCADPINCGGMKPMAQGPRNIQFANQSLPGERDTIVK